MDDDQLDNGSDPELSGEAEKQFDRLLAYLKRTRGFDFAAYKRTSLMRRMSKRMQAIGIENFADYTDYLEVHPDEFPQLFNHILINVTAFFRDELSWTYLRDEIVPQILAAKGADEPIRIWSAGCASGQEPYSLAMLFSEAMGVDACQQRVKIYASDMDDEALNQARQGAYPAKDLTGVDEALRDRYFEVSGGQFVFRTDLRRALIFGRHDLVNDAPISRLDLLVCRNTLMYFNAEIQTGILARFHFALSDVGYLFLGKAEMLLTHADLFAPVELRYRIFKKVPKATMRERLQVLNRIGDDNDGTRLTRQARIRELAHEGAPVAQLIVDLDGELLFANERARALFALTTRDIGRPFRDLEVSYRPVELRSLLEQAYSERRSVQKLGVERHFMDRVQEFEVEITPLLDDGGFTLGASITFADVSRAQRLHMELQRAKQELETAYEELQSTNEELETTNEELQSTVEELETTNEELQSTNEELETMNEELQSTNEELQTVNAELRERTDDLNRANLFQHSILASIHAGVSVVDRELRILIWNHRMEDLWGLREDEVKGRPFANLDIGLPVKQLSDSVQACLRDDNGGGTVNTVSALTRRGKTIRCRVACSALVRDGGRPHGAIVLVEEMAQ